MAGAAVRGFLHGLGGGILTSPQLTPDLQKPAGEQGIASKVKDVADILGQFLPISRGIKLAELGLYGLGVARNLAPLAQRIW